ncbi:unnamed protein product [Penicillium glandicola]
MNEMEHYGDFMDRLLTLASREAQLRLALYMNRISIRDTTRELTFLMTRTHGDGLSTTERITELEMIQEELREQKLQLTADYDHACAQRRGRAYARSAP